MSTDFSEEDNSICNACGLCCEGYLFSYASLDANDDKREYPELELVDVEGNIHFNLPCSAFDCGTGCTIYAKRPAVCKKYACELLMNFKKKLIIKSQALAMIFEAKRLVNELKDEMKNAEIPGNHLTNYRAQVRYIESELSSKENKYRFKNIHFKYGLSEIFFIKYFHEKSNRP